jgi:hypothetical protein
LASLSISDDSQSVGGTAAMKLKQRWGRQRPLLYGPAVDDRDRGEVLVALHPQDARRPDDDVTIGQHTDWLVVV